MNLLSGILFAVDFYEIILEVSLPFMCMKKCWLFVEYDFSGLERRFLSSAGAQCINGSTRIKKAFHLVILSLDNAIADFVLTVRLLYI